jgi:hypothetical protein
MRSSSEIIRRANGAERHRLEGSGYRPGENTTNTHLEQYGMSVPPVDGLWKKPAATIQHMQV